MIKYSRMQKENPSRLVCGFHGTCLDCTLLVSRSQTAFSSFIFGREGKGSGNLTLEFPCYKIARIWGLLIGDDEAKRSVNPL